MMENTAMWKVTRVEIIDYESDPPLVYSTHTAKNVTLSTQDEGRTLKVFLNLNTVPDHDEAELVSEGTATERVNRRKARLAEAKAQFEALSPERQQELKYRIQQADDEAAYIRRAERAQWMQ